VFRDAAKVIIDVHPGSSVGGTLARILTDSAKNGLFPTIIFLFSF
jgi:hypothetical protein